MELRDAIVGLHVFYGVAMHKTLPAIKFILERVGLAMEGKTHRVDPDFGSTLAVSDRDSQPDCWVNWKVMGQPCNFQVWAGESFRRRLV